MEIRSVEDESTLLALHTVLAAAHDHDYVDLPADPVEEMLPLLSQPESAGELTALYLAREGDTPVGAVVLGLPTLDNLTSLHLDLTVHPAHRRRGLGRELRAFALDEARRRGRSRIHIEVSPGGRSEPAPATPLLAEAGARPVLVSQRRRLDLTEHPPGPAHPAPEGYRVVQWVDRAPEEIVAGVAYLTGRMSVDAPMGEMDYEPESWDAGRYRAKEEAAQARQRTRVATAVVHAATGAVAGITDIGVARAHPQRAYQWDTIVDPAHRGLGLGLVLKTWNHQLLVQRAPGVTAVSTWNAASNIHMIRVNELLGFEVADTWTEWQLDLT